MKLTLIPLLFLLTSNLDYQPPALQQTSEPVKLSELFADLDKYKDQTVRVSGKCVKVNNNIMGKNWVHLQDGSGDELDLTITTQETVTVDSEVVFEGVIKTNVDIGAGYFYKVIMEEAQLVKTEN